MAVNDAVAGEAEEQVLAEGFRRLEGPAGQLGSPAMKGRPGVGGAGNLDLLADEGSVESAGDAMNGVAFWNRPPPRWRRAVERPGGLRVAQLSTA
jgi:hypothetical protein